MELGLAKLALYCFLITAVVIGGVFATVVYLLPGEVSTLAFAAVGGITTVAVPTIAVITELARRNYFRDQ